jgi:SHS family lactate transporter-like MFS transporter
VPSTVDAVREDIPWWKEPTRDQWFAWVAGFLGWTLDAFDFTLFLLIMVPISKAFHVSITNVAWAITMTLWMRIVGGVANGWLADRIGRKGPLMLSIVWYSACNFIAGFSPSFLFLFVFRALLGIGMGAEWPVGASLAMESWPVRSRGFMAGVMQGGWGLGFLLSSAVYGLFYDLIGWRGMLWAGVLPALVLVYIFRYVKEPAVWLENRRQQRALKREVRAPLFAIFKPGLLGNTLNACWWTASGAVIAYSLNLFATHLQVDLHMSPALVATPIMLGNLAFFFACSGWGWVADRIGRRWTLILIAAVGIPLTPLYLLTDNYFLIVVGMLLQGFFAGGGINSQNASYMTERFPTEVRATASGFCYQAGIGIGGLVAPLIAYFATARHMGFAVPMLIAGVLGCVSFIAAVYLGPETKGKILAAELEVA